MPVTVTVTVTGTVTETVIHWHPGLQVPGHPGHWHAVTVTVTVRLGPGP